MRFPRRAEEVGTNLAVWGTLFTMQPPRPSSPFETPPSFPIDDDGWRGDGTVLVVEDEETVRSTVERILRTLGFRVALAPDGAEGVRLFQEDPEGFAVILLDLTMPCMDGAQAIVEIRRLNKRVPVVLMSGYGEQDATARFSGMGLSGFVQKPFDIRTLQRALRSALSEWEADDPKR